MRISMFALCLLTFVLSSACSKEAEAPKLKTSNEKIQVDRLFSHEGVTVYRFEDAGKTIYYAVPYKGPIELTEAHTECRSCGKNCTNCSPEYQQTVGLQ